MKREFVIIKELIGLSDRNKEYGHSVWSMICRFVVNGGHADFTKNKESFFVRLTRDDAILRMSLEISKKPERYIFDIVENLPDGRKQSQRLSTIFKKQMLSYGLANAKGDAQSRKRKTKKHGKKKRRLKHKPV